MASPITTELTCSLIMDGTADATVAAEHLTGYAYQGMKPDQ